MKIERSLFWFQDGDERFNSLSEDFFGLGVLLNRLLNEKYEGKKIKFINLYFFTNNTYNLYPVYQKDTPYYFGGHLSYYGLFNILEFDSLNWNEKRQFVWEKAYKFIVNSAEFTMNNQLLKAIEYAYKQGIAIDYNCDYRLLEIYINVSGQQLKASLWIKFKNDEMYSTLTIENDKKIIFEKEIDKAKNGVEFFLEMYKKLEFDGKNIVIKGRKDVGYLPLKIHIPENLFSF